MLVVLSGFRSILEDPGGSSEIAAVGSGDGGSVTSKKAGLEVACNNLARLDQTLLLAKCSD